MGSWREQIGAAAEQASGVAIAFIGKLALNISGRAYMTGIVIAQRVLHVPGVVLDCVIANGPAETEKQAGACKYHGVKL